MSEVRFIGHGFQGWTRFGATNDGASHRDAATTEQGASRRFYNFLALWFPNFLRSCVLD
jgi:hypothetical protein